MKLIITGQCPALKNSKKITKTGHIYTDKRIKEYMDAAKLEAKAQWKHEPLDKLDNLTIVFYNQDKRKHDTSNQLDTICDVIKQIVVKDDDQFCIPHTQIEYGGVSDRPRTEIWVDFEDDLV